MPLPEHPATGTFREELPNLHGRTPYDRAVLDAVLGDIAGDPTPAPITREEVYRLYRLHSESEDVFIKAYTVDPNRKGMRPGDFRYCCNCHSPATRAASEAFVTAGDTWRTAARAWAALRKDGPA